MLKNYRNYSELQQDFGPGLNVIIGYNAQGKTNLLESIYCLSFGRSFKTRRDAELISWGRQRCLIKSVVSRSSGELDIEVGMENGRKILKINGLEQKRLKDFIGNFNVIIFSPDEIKLVKGGPWERRRFLDNEISQMNSNYRHNLLNYFRALEQRNVFLKTSGGNHLKGGQLEIWNEQLAEFGARVVAKRADFIEKLSVLARLMQRKLTGGNENIEVVYRSCLGLKQADLKDPGALKEFFLKKLLQSRMEDIARKFTTLGPHRDDISITMNGIDIRAFGSQGQQRTCVLSLHLAEMELLKAETGEYPVLLLDDVFSELDEKRKANLLEIVSKTQAFITTTGSEHLFRTKTPGTARFFLINNGSVSEWKGI